jgi:hypothetical protein
VERLEFRALLLDAIERTLALAEQQPHSGLAPDFRIRVLLNRSHDDNANPEFEKTYPEESGMNALRECDSLDEVLELLWRDGRVPEWINTMCRPGEPITLLCCGRYALDEPWLNRHPSDQSLIFNVLGRGWSVS